MDVSVERVGWDIQTMANPLKMVLEGLVVVVVEVVVVVLVARQTER